MLSKFFLILTTNFWSRSYNRSPLFPLGNRWFVIFLISLFLLKSCQLLRQVSRNDVTKLASVTCTGGRFRLHGIRDGEESTETRPSRGIFLTATLDMAL